MRRRLGSRIGRRAALAWGVVGSVALGAGVGTSPAPARPAFWPSLVERVTGYELTQPWSSLLGLAAIGAGTLLGLWLIDLGFRISRRGYGRLLARLSPALRRRRERAFATSQAFFRSLAQSVLILAAAILALNALGVDPLATTGALGIVGLISAGLFRDMINDFVKGFDILTGGHFYVGDFIRVANQSGHVIEFHLKYTRLRLPSGEEVVLPNSQCVPSHRWPDGYLSHHVEFPLADRSRRDDARRVLDAVAAHFDELRERVHDRPVLEHVFEPPGSDVVRLRYRVRVLPTSDALIASEFIPQARAALEANGIALAADPTSFAMNDVETFRKLFQNELTEDQIQELAALRQAPPADQPHPAEADRSP